MSIQSDGYPTLVSLYPNQCRSTKDGLRCMLRVRHPEKKHFNDVGFQRVFWDNTEIIKENKEKPSEPGNNSEGG